MAKKGRAKKAAKKVASTKVTIGSVVIVALICAVFCLFVMPQMTNKDEEQVVVNISTLENALKVSKLSTYETVYNGITTVYNEYDKNLIDCYAYYEATVKASLDFQNIEIKNDELAKKIIVTIPAITLDEPIVPIQKLEYMRVNKNINENRLVARAYNLCIEDVRTEASKQEALLDYAKENAENLIKGLLSPFIDQYNGYKIVFTHKEGN